MPQTFRHPLAAALVALLLGAAASAESSLELPWEEAGLSEREAAVHLLSRLSFGPRPGEIERMFAIGLEEWLEEQLSGRLADPEVEAFLEDSRAWHLSSREIAETYPNPGQVLREAVRAGVASEEELGALQNGGEAATGAEAVRSRVMDFARERGYRRQRELGGELLGQKLYRAVHSGNQLAEVLTDFWFNHFNVSLTDNDSRLFVLAYERDAIRPHVLGSFRAMLEATAKHPAMLLYLDNARSVAEDGAPTAAGQARLEGRRGPRGGFGRGGFARNRDRRPREEERRLRGLNENYARELLELHTLGVDGGYTQEDVVEVARAFTGWAALPPAAMAGRMGRAVDRARRRPRSGFVFEGDFLFRADVHDAGPKRVLGRRLAAGRGIEDGLEVLDLVAAHPATARHLARKLAIRFVADEPPESLVERMAAAFTRSRGDIEATLRSMLTAPEFWSPATRGAKIKSPLELVASAARALGAEVWEPRPLIEWVRDMGQPLYAYQAPTGFPDRAEAWVNTGSLLARMNFGLELATGRIPGVRFDLAALAGHREPESLDAALEIYVPLLLPEGDRAETLRRLRPMVHAEELSAKVEASRPAAEPGPDPFAEQMEDFGAPSPRERRRGLGGRDRRPPSWLPPPESLAQVVGVILGSPEFQRR